MKFQTTSALFVLGSLLSTLSIVSKASSDILCDHRDNVLVHLTWHDLPGSIKAPELSKRQAPIVVNCTLVSVTIGSFCSKESLSDLQERGLTIVMQSATF